MDWKLEVVVVPVSDVDRARSFYTEKAGFNTDLDDTFADDFRIVQLTPPGSACSIMIGTGVVDTPPGSVQGLQMVVSDIGAARAELVERGVDVSDIQVFERGARSGKAVEGAPEGRDAALDFAGFMFFAIQTATVGRSSRCPRAPSRGGLPKT